MIGLQEMHMKGCGIVECLGGNERGIWEGMEEGVVWCGIDEKSRGRGKEGCPLLLSPRVWECIKAHGWRGSRIVWAVGKIGIVKYAWMCVHAPVNVSNGRGRKEMRKFWGDVNECLKRFERERRIVLMGDMNGKVGSNEVTGVVGKWSVDGVNENGEQLMDVCADRGLFLANTFSQHRLIHRYTWRRRDERGKQKSMIDDIAVDERIKNDVLDARVVRGMFDGSDHYVVLLRYKSEIGGNLVRRSVRVRGDRFLLVKG